MDLSPTRFWEPDTEPWEVRIAVGHRLREVGAMLKSSHGPLGASASQEAHDINTIADIFRRRGPITARGTKLSKEIYIIWRAESVDNCVEVTSTAHGSVAGRVAAEQVVRRDMHVTPFSLTKAQSRSAIDRRRRVHRGGRRGCIRSSLKKDGTHTIQVPMHLYPLLGRGVLFK